MEKIVPVSSICPEGYEIDREKSTFERIVFKPKKESYSDVCKELFYNKKCFFFDVRGNISSLILCDPYDRDLINCTSENQAKKLLAINQLMNVAKYLNGDWQFNWEEAGNSKFYIALEHNKIRILEGWVSNVALVYFRTKELAQKAIDILGEKTIKLALSTDW